MWFRVAALLGMPVAEAQQRVSSAEFVDWCAFYSLEPWGYEVGNWRMGVLGATIANYSGRVKKALKPSDFFPQRPQKLSRAEMREYLKRLKNV